MGNNCTQIRRNPILRARGFCNDNCGKEGSVMYKFLHNNQIHFAPGFPEARQQVGLVLPEGIDPINHFIVRIWHWDENEKNYDIEVFDAPGHKVFKEYDDALTCFKFIKIHAAWCCRDGGHKLLLYEKGYFNPVNQFRWIIPRF